MNDSEIKQFIKQELAGLTIIPVGAIFAFPSETIPDGYLPCEGQEVSISQYPELYKLIGNTFGGSSKTFNLPDLQGQFVRGLDREGSIDINEKTGNPREIGDLQEDSLQGHQHSIPSLSTSGNGSHSHRVFYTTYKVGSNTFSKNDSPVYEIPIEHYNYHSLGGDPGTDTCGDHSHSIPSTKTGGAENHTYGIVRIGSETRPMNMALIYCIRVK